MIIKLFSEAPQKTSELSLDHKELKKSLFPFFGLPIYRENSGKKCLLIKERFDSLYWLAPNFVSCPYGFWSPSNPASTVSLGDPFKMLLRPTPNTVPDSKHVP